MQPKMPLWGTKVAEANFGKCATFRKSSAICCTRSFEVRHGSTPKSLT